MFDVLAGDVAGVFQRERAARTDAFPFEALVPAFELAVALRIVRAGAHMGHATDADEFLEIPRDELRAVVGDDAGTGLGMLLLGSLQDGFDVGFFHLLPDFPMDDGAAATVQHAAQVVKGAADVEVGDVDVPMLVRLQRLDKAGSFLGRSPVTDPQQPGPGQHPIDAGGIPTATTSSSSIMKVRRR